MVANSSEPFLVQYNLRWMCDAVLPTDAGSLWSFKSFPRVCAYLQNRGFNYSKAAVLVVVCPLTTLIYAHMKELKDHATLQTQKLLPLDSQRKLGGLGPGYFRIFLRKKSWPSHLLEWINAWPFRNTQTETSDPPPPPLPIEDKNNRKLKIANWKCFLCNRVHLRTK